MTRSKLFLAAACTAATATAAAMASPLSERVRMLMHFNEARGEPSWHAVNDTVMGGRSNGAASVEGGVLRFTGALSLANNGGFASVRTDDRVFDLDGAEAIVLRVRGDGRRYEVRLQTDARHRGIPVSYGAGFDTRAGQWTLARVPLAAFEPSVHGTPLDGPALDASEIREFGLLIGDKREGPFALEVDWIGVERANSTQLDAK